MGYPDEAGFKVEGTSAEAAATVNALTLRQLCLSELTTMGLLTADEIAERLQIDRLAIRPRLSELRLLGQVEDSGDRRPNASGKRAIVWRLAQSVQEG